MDPKKVVDGVPLGEVEREIPIPNSVTGRGSCKYPIVDLDIGESFLIPGTIKNAHSRATALVNYWQRKLRRRYTVRKVDGGVRVWRVEDTYKAR